MDWSELVNLFINLWGMIVRVLATQEGQDLLNFLESLLPGGETPQEAAQAAAAKHAPVARPAAAAPPNPKGPRISGGKR